MSYKHFLTVILTITIIACKEDKKDISICEKIIIDPTKTTEIKRSEIFSLSRIIQLENHPKNVIGQTQFGLNIVPNKDFIIVAGKDIGLYDKSGNFLNNIGRKGKGPGEYVTRSMILPCNKKFRLLDRSQNKIIDYDVNGAFIEEYYFGMFGQSFICWNNYNIIYTGNELTEYKKRLFLFDKNFSLIDGCFSLNDSYHYMNMFDKTNFFVYQDSLRFLNAFDYNIYNIEITQNTFEIEPRYYIDFGKFEIPKSFFEQEFNDIREYHTSLEKTHYAHQIMGFIENKDNVFFAFKQKDNRYLAIYCKQNKKSMVVDKIHDDFIFKGLDFSLFSEFMSYYYYDNQIYFVMDAYRFLDNINLMMNSMSENDWNIYKSTNSNIVKLYNEIDEYDNPIIFVFDLKPLII